MPEPVDFFIHVPKTAGTTMLRIIEERYPPGSVESLYLAPPGEAAARIKKIGPRTRIVAGHVDYSYSRNFPGPFRAFAMLREPVARAISLFYFVKREPSHPSHQAVLDGKISIEEISRKQGGMQARFIAGYSPVEPVDDAVLLAQAKENLVEKLAVFGLTERFDETLLLLTKALGWPLRGYARMNVTKQRPGKGATDPALLAAIREASVVDVTLYEFARDLFERRLAAQPPEFADDLAALRRDATLVHGVNRVREGLRSVGRRLGICRKSGSSLL